MENRTWLFSALVKGWIESDCKKRSLENTEGMQRSLRNCIWFGSAQHLQLTRIRPAVTTGATTLKEERQKGEYTDLDPQASVRRGIQTQED